MRQRASRGSSTVSRMKLVSIKATVSLAWVLAVCVMSLATWPHSRATWAALAAVALVPSVMMMWWWHDPRQTMSERINEARR